MTPPGGDRKAGIAGEVAMAGFAFVLAMLVATPSVHEAEIAPIPETSSGTDVVQGQTDRDKRMTVPVAIDGEGPFHFLIDTGSQRTALSTDIAARLGLETGPTVTVVSVAGTDLVQTAYVEEMAFGRRSLSGLVVPLFETRNMGADGIIGTDGLQNQRVLLDFGRNVIEIGEAETLGGNNGYEIVVRARRRSGQLVMTQATIDGVHTHVVLDTGAGTSVGNKALQRALARRGGPANLVTLKSVTGQSITAEIGIARKLKIREVGITNLIIAFADTPAFRELRLHRRPAIFLGMRELRLFKRVAIDFAARKVMFDMPAMP